MSAGYILVSALVYDRAMEHIATFTLGAAHRSRTLTLNCNVIHALAEKTQSYTGGTDIPSLLNYLTDISRFLTSAENYLDGGTIDRHHSENIEHQLGYQLHAESSHIPILRNCMLLALDEVKDPTANAYQEEICKIRRDAAEHGGDILRLRLTPKDITNNLSRIQSTIQQFADTAIAGGFKDRKMGRNFNLEKLKTSLKSMNTDGTYSRDIAFAERFVEHPENVIGFLQTMLKVLEATPLTLTREEVRTP